MPYFCVTMHGEGIRIRHNSELESAFGFPQDENALDIVGFYTTRWVRAKNQKNAAEIAAAMIMKTWSTPIFRNLNIGTMPVLDVDEIREIGLIEFLRRRPGKGHAFYPEEVLD